MAGAAARTVPEAGVLDQDGRSLAFHRDLVKGKTVAINFIFTTCTAICPTQTATFREVQRSLGERVGRDIALLSISIDPATDVPQRMKAFAQRFDAGAGWHFLTGRKPEIDTLLRALGAATADKADHNGLVLVINEATGTWTRLDGLAAAPVIVRAVEQAAAAAEVKAAASRYFPNLPLLTQDGRRVRFYDDVMKDKVVLINFMFTTCPGICSPMTANLAKVQDLLGDRVGRDVHMVSITVDPAHDTPEILKKFADGFHIKPGWTFLTGTTANIDQVRSKLGGYSEDKEAHNPILLAGNLNTGEWKKLRSIAAPADIVAAVMAMLPGAQP